MPLEKLTFIMSAFTIQGTSLESLVPLSTFEMQCLETHRDPSSHVKYTESLDLRYPIVLGRQSS